MLRPIDRFISAVRRGEGEEIVFSTGQPVRVRSGDQMRVLLAQPVRADQIQAILADIVPSHIDRGFTSDGDASFVYEATGGPITVHLRRLAGRLDAVLRPVVAPSVAAPPRSPASTSFVQVNKPGSSTSTFESSRTQVDLPSRAAVGAERSAAVGAERSAAVGAERSAAVGAARSAAVGAERSAVVGAERSAVVGAERSAAVGAERSAAVGAERSAGPSELTRASTQAVPAFVAPPQERPTEPMAPAPAAVTSGGRKQIDPMLHTLVQQKASDLHITATMQPRMRKDGDIGMLPGFERPLDSDAIRAMLMEMAPPLAREKFEKTNDTDFAYEIPGLARFRVNAFKDRRGVSGVLRVIPSKILTAEQLNLPPVVRELCGLHKGLVLVTGPTGSGKSTTLAAMVDLINKNRSDHIITIEDPVEFVHETQGCLVNQREVHVDTQSFSAALRAALREDPDIVLVGEMRDLETVAIAIETAETGHLVFGTLHTTTAVGTVDRIIDQFPSDRQQQIRMMLSESLKGVVAQTLCKKIGGGRIAALEILVGSNAVSNLIREGKTFQIPSLMQTQKQAGMQTLNDALFALVKDGLVAPEEAFHKSIDRTSFRMMLEKAGVKLEKH